MTLLLAPYLNNEIKLIKLTPLKPSIQELRKARLKKTELLNGKTLSRLQKRLDKKTSS